MEPLNKKKKEEDDLINSVMGSSTEQFNVHIHPNDFKKVRKTKSLLKNHVGLTTDCS